LDSTLVGPGAKIAEMTEDVGGPGRQLFGHVPHHPLTGRRGRRAWRRPGQQKPSPGVSTRASSRKRCTLRIWELAGELAYRAAQISPLSQIESQEVAVHRRDQHPCLGRAGWLARSDVG